MARKLDLLSLFAEKQRQLGLSGKVESGPPRRAAPPRQRGQLVAWMRSHWQSFTALFSPPSRKPAARRTPEARTLPHGFLLSGATLAAIVFSSLGAGFLLGKALGRSAADRGAGELRAAERGSGLRPDWLGLPPAKSAAILSPEKEEEELERFYYPVLLYRASQRAEVQQMASYLRDKGVASARVRRLTIRGAACFGTVVYVPAIADGPRYLTALTKVPPPSFMPPETVKDFQENLGMLGPPETLRDVTEPGN